MKKRRSARRGRTPFPSGCKRRSKNIQRFAARQPPCYAQVLEQAFGPDCPIFSNPNTGHYTLRWVMRQVFRCLIRKKGEGKGEWWKDPAKGGGGAGHTQPVRGSPMCPLGERVSSSALGALNHVSDPCGVRFDTGEYLVCLQPSLALD